MREIEIRDLGRMEYVKAWALQKDLSERRKRGEIRDQLLFVEHPHVFTLGRNGRMENLLASREHLAEMGIDLVEIDRGGDITYHGPGQVIGYPIVDLREWKKDVVAYVRGLEEVVISTLRGFGIESGRDASATGVWIEGAKICAIGVHISRWVTTHGFALNWNTDLKYFDYIVPCGLTRPVTSMRKLGAKVDRPAVLNMLLDAFAEVFEYRLARLTAPAGKLAGL
jgi:lipoate-protein ligase B